MRLYNNLGDNYELMIKYILTAVLFLCFLSSYSQDRVMVRHNDTLYMLTYTYTTVPDSDYVLINNVSTKRYYNRITGTAKDSVQMNKVKATPSEVGIDTLRNNVWNALAAKASTTVSQSQVTSLTTDLAARQIGNSAYLINAFTTSNTTATNTNLTFAISANEKYVVTIEGVCSKATSATGLKFAIAAPAGATISGVQYGGAALLATPLVPSLISSINTLGTTLATGIGVPVAFRLNFVIINSSTPGNVTFQAATVTSNTMTINAGASMVWQKATGL